MVLGVCVGMLDYFIWSNTGKMEAVIAQMKGKYMRVVYVMERPTVRLSLGGCSAL